MKLVRADQHILIIGIIRERIKPQRKLKGKKIWLRADQHIKVFWLKLNQLENFPAHERKLIKQSNVKDKSSTQSPTTNRLNKTGFWRFLSLFNA